jgi:hypothetical protein
MKRALTLGALLVALVACKEDETLKPWNQGQFNTEVTVSTTGSLTLVPQARPFVAEDSPGWDCELDGNRNCTAPMRAV